MGEYRANLREGHGAYFSKNGEKFVGEYAAGKRNGHGTFYWKDGCVDIGTYKGGNDCGDGVRWSKDRQTAYRLRNGKDAGEIPLSEAREFAERMGFGDVASRLAKMQIS